MSELDRASLDRTLPRGLAPLTGTKCCEAQAQGERRGRRLVAVVAALLVLVVGTASAFGTVRDLFGNGTRGGGAFHAMEGERGSFFLRRRIHYRRRRQPHYRRRRQPIAGLADRGCRPRGSTGQYAQVTGRGRYVGLRPIRSPRLWHARLEGFVTRPGEATQHVVITEKGGLQGVFVLTPLQPGILKRDSGTVSITRR